MNIKDLRQLVKLMVENDLSELEIADDQTKVHLKRGPDGVPAAAGSVPAAAPVDVAGEKPAPAETPPEAPAEEFVEIRSPMVGTFYTASGPDSEPFVQVGSDLAEDTVVCIVEAMKVMNEIKAECSGVIAEICVKNAQPVEYGQVLFRLRPV